MWCEAPARTHPLRAACPWGCRVALWGSRGPFLAQRHGCSEARTGGLQFQYSISETNVIITNRCEIDVTRGYLNWRTREGRWILSAIYSQYSQRLGLFCQNGDSQLFSCSQDTNSAHLIIILSMIWATEQLLIRNCNHSESKHPFNYRGINQKIMALEHQSHRMRFGEGPLRWLPPVNPAIKIRGYYVSYSNGLFNKTLIACIILHSSLLYLIRIQEVLCRINGVGAVHEMVNTHCPLLALKWGWWTVMVKSTRLPHVYIIPNATL